jgi:hypothetical protein
LGLRALLDDWALLGGTAYWRSTPPPLQYSDGYGRYEFFLTRRGAEGRAPDIYEADVHLGYPVELPRGASLHLLLDVFNVLDAQRPILLDQRWGFQEADNTSPVPVNPNYGDLSCARRRPPSGSVRLSF